MNFYEVFVKLVNHGKEVGRTCIQLQATSPLMAAMEAEKSIDHRYGLNITSRTVKVSPITEEEFIYSNAMAA